MGYVRVIMGFLRDDYGFSISRFLPNMGFVWEEYGTLWEDYGILWEEYGISQLLAFKNELAFANWLSKAQKASGHGICSRQWPGSFKFDPRRK